MNLLRDWIAPAASILTPPKAKGDYNWSPDLSSWYEPKSSAARRKNKFVHILYYLVPPWNLISSSPASGAMPSKAEAVEAYSRYGQLEYNGWELYHRDRRVDADKYIIYFNEEEVEAAGHKIFAFVNERILPFGLALTLDDMLDDNHIARKELVTDRNHQWIMGRRRYRWTMALDLSAAVASAKRSESSHCWPRDR